MISTPSTETVVALCGPSGIGKGFTKRLIQAEIPILRTEPVVVTTRAPRADDNESRRAGLSEHEFDELVASGAVVLDHRPFRVLSSPRYGFDAESLQSPALLTEAHSTILGRFRREFVSRPVLMVGCVASVSALRDNIFSRQPHATDNELRLSMSQLEMAEIQRAYDTGIVEHIVNFDLDRRDDAQRAVVDRVKEFAGDI